MSALPETVVLAGVARENHLHEAELVCRSGAKYPVAFRDDPTRLPQLRATFNTIRETYGRALRVISGYRDPGYNADLRLRSISRLLAAGRTRAQAEIESGVAKHSQHLEGRALDIVAWHLPVKYALWKPQHFADHAELSTLIETLIIAGKLPALKGFGKYRHWLHIDTRPAAVVARWGSLN